MTIENGSSQEAKLNQVQLRGMNTTIVRLNLPDGHLKRSLLLSYKLMKIIPIFIIAVY